MSLLANNRHQWLRFLISGGAGFLLYYTLALVLHRLTAWTDGWCALVATLLAIAPTFLLQKRFTFRSGGEIGPQVLGYLLLQLVSAALIGAAAHAGAKLGLPVFLGFFVAGLLGVVFSYLVQTIVIFRK